VSGENHAGAGAGGGAGTGVYVQQPGSGSPWELLVGVGGGGGGSVAAGFCIVGSSDGGYARTSIDGLGPIENGGGFGGGLSGFGGREGGYPDDPGDYGGGGGGTLSDGRLGSAGGDMAFPGRSSGGQFSSAPAGGAGWGGGGGADGKKEFFEYVPNEAGGGGGYSGGGGEGPNTSDSGGGGAFVSTSFNDDQVVLVLPRVTRSEARQPLHGVADYSLQPNYQVSPQSFWVGAAGTVTVEVVAALDGAAPWTAAVDDSWLSVDTASGTGNATVQITFDENTGTGLRFGSVAIAGQVVTIAQPVGNNLVTSTGDAVLDFGSLRSVIENALPGATIRFDASLSGATIFLDPVQGELVIDKTLTLDATELEGGLTICAGGP